jgi:hypothetical protein
MSISVVVSGLCDHLIKHGENKHLPKDVIEKLR